MGIFLVGNWWERCVCVCRALFRALCALAGGAGGWPSLHINYGERGVRPRSTTSSSSPSLSWQTFALTCKCIRNRVASYDVSRRHRINAARAHRCLPAASINRASESHSGRSGFANSAERESRDCSRALICCRPGVKSSSPLLLWKHKPWVLYSHSVHVEDCNYGFICGWCFQVFGEAGRNLIYCKKCRLTPQF
jgi:hypothetical protein